MEKIEFDYSKYDFKNPTSKYKIIFNEGLSEDVIKAISKLKAEPEWMMEFRLQAYKFFTKRPVPTWGADLSKINFNNITYFARAIDKKVSNWDELPKEIKETYDKLGIPQPAISQYKSGLRGLITQKMSANKDFMRYLKKLTYKIYGEKLDINLKTCEICQTSRDLNVIKENEIKEFLCLIEIANSK